jgi:hypothetical protein
MSGSQAQVPNILKTRDDSKPVAFIRRPEQEDSLGEFELKPGSSTQWIEAGTPFGPDKLRSRIEPWLTALCQSEHFSLLLGSGLSTAVHHLAT